MNDNKKDIKIAFVGSYRRAFDKGFTKWCEFALENQLKLIKSGLSGETKIQLCLYNEHDSIKDKEAKFASSTLIQSENIIHQLKSEDLSALIICSLDFGDSRSAAYIAKALNIPVFLYGLIDEKDTSYDLSSTDAPCGILSISSSLKRKNVNFIFGGLVTVNDSKFPKKIQQFISSIKAKESIINKNICAIGSRPDSFDNLSINEEVLNETFNTHISRYSIEKFISIFESNTKTDNTNYFKDSLVKNNCKACVSDDYFIKANKVIKTILQCSKKLNTTLFSIDCWEETIDRLQMNVCAIMGLLAEYDIIMSCEGDIYSTLALQILKAISNEKMPVLLDIANISEDIGILLWHCGNAPLSICNNLKLKSRFDMDHDNISENEGVNAGLLQGQLTPGIVTLYSLTNIKGDWKSIVSIGGISKEPQKSLPGVWGFFETNNARKLYSDLIEGGFSQHVSIVYGSYIEEIKMFSKLAGFDVLSYE